MNWGAKNFHRIFAAVSLGFALLVAGSVPLPLRGAATNSSVKLQAASSQFTRAEELRALLNSKPADQRTLSEYKKVVTGYQRVYMITPHAAEVPDALVAVAELNTEMGDRFGRSYYQTAADTYAYLIRDYPASKHVQDAMLLLAKLQKDQLGDLAAATKTYQDFAKKYPRSTHKREVQEALAELALRKSAETGEIVSKSTTPPPSAAPAKPEIGPPDGKKTSSGGEVAQSGSIPRVQKIRTNVTPDSTEVIIDLEDSVQYASGRIANPDRIYFDLHAARLTPAMARANIHVSGDLLTKVRVAQNQEGVVRVVLDVSGVRDYAVSLTKKPTRLVIELYSSMNGSKTEPAQSAKASKNPPGPNNSASVEATTPAKEIVAADLAGPSLPSATPQATVSGNSTGSAAVTSAAKPVPEPSKTSLTRPGSSRSKSKPELIQPVSAPHPRMTVKPL